MCVCVCVCEILVSNKCIKSLGFIGKERIGLGIEELLLLDLCEANSRVLKLF